MSDMTARIVNTSMRPLFKSTGSGDSANTDADAIVATLPARAIDVRGYGQGELIFSGTGGDGGTMSYRILGFKAITKIGGRHEDSQNAGLWLRRPLAAGTLTLGTLTGSGDTLIPSGHTLADTISETSLGYEAFQTSHFGEAVSAYSPADNTIAALGIQFGNFERIAVYVWDDSTDEAHAFITLGT
jgi:hypothetical protein